MLLFVTCLLPTYSQNELKVGYSIIDSPAPVGTALFGFRNGDGVLLWEAGVEAARPIRAGRIFVDQLNRRTALALVNLLNAPNPVRLTLRSQAGNQVAQVQRILNAREHLALFADELFAQASAGFVGSLTFEAEGGGQTLAAITLRQTSSFRGEPIFATLPVADLDETASTASIFIPQVGAGAGLATQIVLINRQNQAIGGRIRLFGTNGAPLVLSLEGVPGSQFNYQIPANGVFRGELSSPAGTGVGYAVVTLDSGTASPAGSAIFQFRAGADVITEAGVTAIRPTTRARIFVDAAGTRTGVALASAGNAATVTLRLRDRLNREVESTSRDLPAGGHLAVFADELFPDMPPGFTGILEIDSSSEIAPVTLKLTQNLRGDLVLTTLPIFDVNRPPSGSAVFPQIGIGLGFSTRLIFISANLNAASQGTFRFFSSNGSALPLALEGANVSFLNFQLPAGASRQFYPGVTAGVGDILIDEGRLVVNEGGSLFVQAAVLDQEGHPRDDFALSYQSLAPNVVTVSQAGELSGKSRGFSTLTASSGGVVESVTVTVATITGGTPGFEYTGVAQDFGGQLYLAGTGTHTLLLAPDLQSAPAVYAGALNNAGFKDDLRLSARFNAPSFLALDHYTGLLYVSDGRNHRIRRVQPGTGGQVATVAGDGVPGHRDGATAQARFRNPQGAVRDDGGQLWVCDADNHVIRRIDLITNQVTTVAGLAGSPGSSDGVGQGARFNTPLGIALETESLAQQLEREGKGLPPPPVSVIVADNGNGLLRRVFQDGTVQTIGSTNVTPAASPSHPSPQASGGADSSPAQAAATPLRFTSPVGVVVDSFGNIYVSEATTGKVKVALQNGQVALAVQAGTFRNPQAMTNTIRGRIVVAETNRSVQQIRYAGPTLFDISPRQVSAAGSERVTVTGVNMAPDIRVVIGGVIIPRIDFDNTGRFSFLTPPLPPGRQTVTLEHRGGLAQGSIEVLPVRASALQPGQITTVVGGTNFVGDGLLGPQGILSGPRGLAIDIKGDVLIADSGHHRVRRLGAISGILTSAAGNGLTDPPGDGNPALLASLFQPSSVARDASGDLYITDTRHHRIRRLRNGILTTVAGNGQPGSGGDGGKATAAGLRSPEGVAVDEKGNLWIADTGNHRVRQVNPSGVITTVAGDGQPGHAGDGKDARGARLNSPRDVLLDAAGNLFIADGGNNIIRVVDTAGIITSRFEGLLNPSALAFDPDGQMLIADTGNHRIVRILRGTPVTVAGIRQAGFSGDGQQATQAALNSPQGVEADAAGNLWIADTGNHRIRKVTPGGVISTAAGGPNDFSGDGGPPHLASLLSPAGIALDGKRDLYIAELAGDRLRRVGVSANVLTGSPGLLAYDTTSRPALITTLDLDLDAPAGVAVSSQGDVFVGENGRDRVVRLAPSGQITTHGEKALNAPFGTALFQNTLYVADRGNHGVKRINLNTGAISHVAGVGFGGFFGDGGPADSAALNQPSGVAVDEFGNLFIADTGNHRIRHIDARNGVISTVAGAVGAGFSGDGRPATQARLNSPQGVAAGKAGLYIADTGNHRIRLVEWAKGVISTIAGNGVAASNGDGKKAVEAAIHSPVDVKIDPAPGHLLITDSGGGRVRLVVRVE